MALLSEAIRWYTAGYMPVPLRPDGTKAPAVDHWRDYQWERPPARHMLELFKIDSDGIGLLCGGEIQLEMYELEGRAIDEDYLDKLEDAFKAHYPEFYELYTTLLGGYVEFTPGGGLHIYYRVDGKAKGNAKLARRPATEAELKENPGHKLVPLIETRGQGGFTVIAPSGGRSHPTGRAWYVQHGTGPESIPVITESQRNALYEITKTLDQTPAPSRVDPVSPPPGNLTPAKEGRPGDDFNAKATWEQILGPHGWTIYKHYGGISYGWQRPGKRHAGLSATTGANDADQLYVFSTATEFEIEKAIDKFGAYALLNYGGDIGAASRALRAAGYGDRDPLDQALYPHASNEGGKHATPLASVSYIGANALAPKSQPEPGETGFIFTHGGSFILDTDPNPVAVWGKGESVLMASGEALIIAAPQGCGKTTLAGQLMLGRCGFEEYSELLDYPILPGQGRVLYLAMDRPKQAARSFRRMVGDSWREELDSRLLIWQGPPPGDFAKYPGLLLELCKRAEADTVIVDSLKDAAVGLSDDDIGAGYNRARQTAIAASVEVIELHHLRKLPATRNSRPPSIDDLFGSTWLTSGAGSVILLSGEPGDSTVGLQHIKQPATEVGPFKIHHDHQAGRTTRHKKVDVLVLARQRLSGISELEAARAMYETDKPIPAEKRSAGRELARLVKADLLEVISEGQPGGEPTRYGAKARDI